ncbi:hypothetical protein ANCCAN_22617, partial [Ancylostoma caninum]
LLTLLLRPHTARRVQLTPRHLLLTLLLRPHTAQQVRVTVAAGTAHPVLDTRRHLPHIRLLVQRTVRHRHSTVLAAHSILPHRLNIPRVLQDRMPLHPILHHLRSTVQLLQFTLRAALSTLPVRLNTLRQEILHHQCIRLHHHSTAQVLLSTVPVLPITLHLLHILQTTILTATAELHLRLTVLDSLFVVQLYEFML